MIPAFFCSLLHCYRVVRRCLRVRILLSPLQFIPEKFSRTAAERQEIMGTLYNSRKGQDRTQRLTLGCQLQLDFFQINFTIVWLILAVELIV